ncbi:putative bifunctional diguanylate cyclase/phosphodiesterase [Silvibacterium acidisoli]|uniref:putative bifunctional diguanylate cyclase/phosphodiesterase n=1 Tax=Acidobacteriaceae bacterium ZG23-2 TaxID=2883246 RepID=UPI00406BEAAA
MAQMHPRAWQGQSGLRSAPDIRQAAHAVPNASTLEDILHELRVREIELEIQNEELRRVQLTLEESRDRYLDLYEFAPAGYLTLDEKGIIQEINLAGAALLGCERSRLLRRSLCKFIAPDDGDRYHQALSRALKRTEQNSIALKLNRPGDSAFHVQMNCVRVIASDGSVTVRVTLIDINESKRAEAEVENLAFYDSLTQLPNRRLLMERLRQSLASSSRTKRHGAVLFIDLDDFKTLNDTQGHDIGDLLLKSVGNRLLTSVREGDTVARLGGDEFVIMLQDLSENQFEAVSQGRAAAEKILTLLKMPHLLEGHDYRSSGSIGISLYSGTQTSVEELLKHADLALYRAKGAGRGTLKFYDPEMQAAVTARAVLESDLRRGLEGRQFVLRYQRQVNGKGQMVGAEALVRWEHPIRGLLLPEEFIPLTQEKGLIGLLGQWILETACAQLVAWSSEPATAHLTVSINVSAQEFFHPEFVRQTLATIDRIGADPRKLMLEVTESVVLEHMEEALVKIRDLKLRGVSFALDDFGTGYSSLTYLKRLSFDHLKIDRSLVRDVLKDPIDQSIARIVIALGHSLGLQITVEGIETVEQRDFFALDGCQCFQGFLFGHPAPVESLL